MSILYGTGPRHGPKDWQGVEWNLQSVSAVPDTFQVNVSWHAFKQSPCFEIHSSNGDNWISSEVCLGMDMNIEYCGLWHPVPGYLYRYAGEVDSRLKTMWVLKERTQIFISSNFFALCIADGILSVQNTISLIIHIFFSCNTCSFCI